MAGKLPKPIYSALPFVYLAAGFWAHVALDYWTSGVSTASLISAGALVMNWRGWIG